MRIRAFGVAATLLAACSGAPTAPQTAATVSATRATEPQASATPAPIASGIRALPELAKLLAAERVTGTIALLDSQDGVLGCSDVKRCEEAVSPASTFKIAHSMIALEAGIVEGPDTILPWDRQTYSVEAWNEDLKFRDAFRLSCVPCFRGIAHRVGAAGERDWVDKLGYGNRDTSGGEMFWLHGGLRISPAEQIAFLRRFDADKLPISSRTADIVRDVMTLDVTENYVLRGKTGAATPPEEERELYWFVGWLELGERRIFFATLLDGHAPDVDPLPLRRSLTQRVLHDRGWL
jgi:beta-lactamase class D